MTKSTITREQRINEVKELIANAEEWAGYYEHPIHDKPQREIFEGMARVMAEHLAALTAMDSEPVALQPELAKVIYHFRDWNEGFPVERFKADYVISWMLANYPPAQPAPERDQVRSAHAEWSQATFGNVGPVGPLKHLSKEVLEAAAEPGDLSEWADMQFLLWDAQRRAGVTDEQITQAMIEKLAVNKQRSWPEPKDGEPRLHIKEQPAPVVPAVSDDIGEIRVGRLPTMNQDDYPGLGDWWVQLRIGEDSDEVLARVYGATPQEANNRAEALACRAAMLQELKKSAGTEATCRGNENAQVLNTIKAPPALGSLPKTGEVQNTNSPVIPDGYVMVPKEPTDEMIAAAMNCEDVLFNSDDSFCVQFGNIYEAMLAAAPQSPGSEPATVPGKWIPVSERMPEDEQEVLTINKMGHRFVSFFDKHSGLFFDRLDAPAACCIEHVLVTHWMPPPCAPQEVK